MCLEGQILLLSAFSAVIWQFKFHLKSECADGTVVLTLRILVTPSEEDEEQLACSWHVLVLGSDPFSIHTSISSALNGFFWSPFHFLFVARSLWLICVSSVSWKSGAFFYSFFSLSLRLWLKMSWRKGGELSFVSGPSSLCGREVTSDPQSCLVFGWKAEGDGGSWKLSPPKGSSSPGLPSHHRSATAASINPSESITTRPTQFRSVS